MHSLKPMWSAYNDTSYMNTLILGSVDLPEMLSVGSTSLLLTREYVQHNKQVVKDNES